MKQKLPERRRFIRVDVPLKVTVRYNDRDLEGVTRNVSPIGLRFEIGGELKVPDKLDLSLYLPSIKDPIKLKGIVVWQKKTSLEDKAPYDVGVEIVEIEDACKNIFLKYLCDLLYDATYKTRI